MMRISRLMVFLCLILHSAANHAEHPNAYIVSPSNGAVVSNPVTVVFGLRNGFGVAPAGVTVENTGHHHLLIDTALPDLAQPIPNDDQHRHFGGGQTEVTLELSAGDHSLQLLLGNFAHIAHQPAVMSDRITITVK
ncbi:MAG: hypothetical protein ACI9BW_000798 [Gammaproteobacteria bacterium]|jgi:hypothetical protein